MTSSATLQYMITVRLLKRSARYPAGAAKTIYGMTRHAKPADNAVAACSAPTMSLPMGTTSQRNILSFMAPRNCVNKSPIKLREIIPSRPSLEVVAGG